MADRNLKIKYSTEGFAETINSLQKVGVSFDNALAKAKKSVSEAAAAAARAGGAGDAKGFEAAESAKVRAANQASRLIAQSYRELGVRSSADIERAKQQAISAFAAMKSSGVASARDIAVAQDALKRKVAELDQQLKQSGGPGGGFTVWKGALSSFLGGLALQAFNAVGNAVQRLGQQVIATGAAAERQAVAFETFLGSAEKAQKLLKEVREFAATTPFELPEVTEAAKTLLAKGVEADQIIPSIRRLGEIAAGADKPLNQLLFVYGQIKDQGKAFGQDLNQLTNAGISIGDIAKALNVGQKEVRQLVSEGKFGFEELEKVIVSVTSEGGRFNGLMEKLGGTTAVKLSNVNDSFTKIYQAIYNGVSPALAAVLDTIIEVVNPLGENERLFAGINEQAQAFRDYIKENPQIVDAIAKSLEDGMQVAMTSIAGLAQQTLDFLKQNPTAIADAVKNLGTLLQGMGKLLELINFSLYGFRKLGAAISSTGEALAKATGNFDYNTNSAGSRIDERLTPELFTELAGEVGATPAQVTEIKGAIAKKAQESVGFLANLVRGDEYYNAYDTAARDELYKFARSRGITNLRERFGKGSAQGNENGLVSPIPGATSSNGGGYPEDSGLDFLVPEGTEIVSATGGTLVYAERGHTSWTEDAAKTRPGYQPPHSVLVKLDKPIEAYGKTLAYAYYTHMISVAEDLLGKGTDHGKPVRIQPGQRLGEVGTANNVPHLHFGLVADRAQTSWLNYQEVHELLYGTRDTSGRVSGSGTAASRRPSVPSRSAQIPTAERRSGPKLGSKQQALIRAAKEIGMPPEWLAAIISKESGFSPSIYGGEGGNYMGLIQFGPAERAAYGANSKQSFEEQVSGPVVRYFKDRGFKNGMTIEQAYATVLGGNPHVNIHSQDSFGTSVASAAKGLKSGEHYQAAMKFLGGKAGLADQYGIEDQNQQFFAEQAERQRILEEARQRADTQRQQQQQLLLRNRELDDQQKLEQFDLETAQTPEGPTKGLRGQKRTQLERELSAQRELLEIQQGIENLDLQRKRKLSGESSDARDLSAEIAFLQKRATLLKASLELQAKIDQAENQAKIDGLVIEADAAVADAIDNTEQLRLSYGDLTEEVRDSQLSRQLNEQFAPYKDQVVAAIRTVWELIETKKALGLETEREQRQLEALQAAYLAVIGVQQQATQKAALGEANAQRQENANREIELAQLNAQIAEYRAKAIEDRADPFLEGNEIREENALAVARAQQELQQAQLQERLLAARSNEERLAIQQVIDKTKELNDLELTQISSQFENLGDVIAQAIGSALQGFFNDLKQVFEGTKSLGDAVLSFFSNLFGQIAQFFFQQGLRGLMGVISGALGGLIGGGASAGGSAGGIVGGLIGGFAEGGYVSNRLGLVSGGEFVLQAAAVANLGTSLLEELNRSGRPSRSFNRVDFEDRNSSRRSVTPQINMTVMTPDANSFRKSESQIGREAGELYRRSVLRNS
ncbi:MAG: transglycosylase SLT domain-containing protein [Acaryochloridaceae cyanobacterium SU_2_1]|nr:transglycosylase SLT domain-containing protein [Acaryochloridaceae cyanobacterium SU_2_1]